MGRFIPNENTIIKFGIRDPGSLDAPTGVTATPAGTGGTVAAGTYHYKVVALKTAGGNSLPSAAVDATTTGSTSSVVVAWTAEADADGGFDVYRSTASGAFLKLAHVAAGTDTVTDTGAVTPAGVIPTKDTSSDLSMPSFAKDIEPAIDLTDLTSSFNASSQGNSVPTPSFARLFETSIIGTSQATFTADFYRDDEDDLAWDTLPRKTKGVFYVTRFGGEIIEGDEIEVWPVQVLSRAMANMANNTVVTFTLTCSVPQEPDESAVVAA